MGSRERTGISSFDPAADRTDATHPERTRWVTRKRNPVAADEVREAKRLIYTATGSPVGSRRINPNIECTRLRGIP
jgi:hypothetical protein